MTFPTNPSNGDQYPNLDNGYLYEWQDPPAAWNVIGKIDDGGGGGNPSPGDGLVEGTDFKFEWSTCVNPGRTSYTDSNGMSVKIDNSKCLSESDYANQKLMYSYDLYNWANCTVVGGPFIQRFVNVWKGTKSNGDDIWLAQELAATRCWKSNDGINWETVPISGLSGGTVEFIAFSKDTIIVEATGGNLVRSTDDGATWSQTSPSSGSGTDWYIDDEIILTTGNSGSGSISIDGGATWGTAGVTGGGTNYGMFRCWSNPSTIYRFNQTGAVFARVSDLLSGNYTFTGAPNFFPLVPSGTGYETKALHAFSSDDRSYVVIVGRAGAQVSVYMFNSNNDAIENYQTFYFMENPSSLPAATAVLMTIQNRFKSLSNGNYPLVLGRSYLQNGNKLYKTDGGVVFGASQKLYYNGRILKYGDILSHELD